jgi:hypothetical protein
LGRDAVENIPTVEFHERPAASKSPIHIFRNPPVHAKPPTPKRSIIQVFQHHPGFSPRSLESGTAKTQEVSSLCSICTEDFTEGARLRKLPCGHVFHPQCIDPWLINRARTCPLWLVSPEPT